MSVWSQLDLSGCILVSSPTPVSGLLVLEEQCGKLGIRARAQLPPNRLQQGSSSGGAKEIAYGEAVFQEKWFYFEGNRESLWDRESSCVLAVLPNLCDHTENKNIHKSLFRGFVVEQSHGVYYHGLVGGETSLLDKSAYIIQGFLSPFLFPSGWMGDENAFLIHFLMERELETCFVCFLY